MTPEPVRLILRRINTSSWALASKDNTCMVQIDTRSAHEALKIARNWVSSFPYLITSTVIEVEDGLFDQR